MYKIYLGDGAYCAVEDGQIILTTENGIEVTNIIYLEPEMVKALVAFATKAGLKV